MDKTKNFKFRWWIVAVFQQICSGNVLFWDMCIKPSFKEVRAVRCRKSWPTERCWSETADARGMRRKTGTKQSTTSFCFWVAQLCSCVLGEKAAAEQLLREQLKNFLQWGKLPLHWCTTAYVNAVCTPWFSLVHNYKNKPLFSVVQPQAFLFAARNQNQKSHSLFFVLKNMYIYSFWGFLIGGLFYILQ